MNRECKIPVLCQINKMQLKLFMYLKVKKQQQQQLTIEHLKIRLVTTATNRGRTNLLQEFSNIRPLKTFQNLICFEKRKSHNIYVKIVRPKVTSMVLLKTVNAKLLFPVIVVQVYNTDITSWGTEVSASSHNPSAL